MGPADPSVFLTAAKGLTLRALRLQSTPPSPLEPTTGEVRAFNPFRQEDVERALEGASALVVGLPVPLPRATIAQEVERDTQSFVVDGIIAAARARAIHHVAVVLPARRRSDGSDRSFLDELGRIIRAYGMDVLDVPQGETSNAKDAIARWLQRCAKQHREPSPPMGPQESVIRKKGTGRSMRSVQRLPLPKGWDAVRLARAYPAWLGASFPWLLRTETDDDGSFRIFSTLSNQPLLCLRSVEHLNDPRRHVAVVCGGRLAADEATRDGWLEFRVLPGRKDAIAAVGDFVPKLPLPLYRLTQAPAHQFVMAGFERHLRQIR